MDTFDGLHEVVLPQLISPPGYVGKLQGEALALGLYFGTLGAVLLYNCFCTYRPVSAGFRLYLLYVACIFLLGLIFRGYAFQYAWPTMPILNNQILRLQRESVTVFRPVCAGISRCTAFGTSLVVPDQCVGILLIVVALLPPPVRVLRHCLRIVGAGGHIHHYLFDLYRLYPVASGVASRALLPACIYLPVAGRHAHYVQLLGWVSASPSRNMGYRLAPAWKYCCWPLVWRIK